MQCTCQGSFVLHTRVYCQGGAPSVILNMTCQTCDSNIGKGCYITWVKTDMEAFGFFDSATYERFSRAESDQWYRTQMS